MFKIIRLDLGILSLFPEGPFLQCEEALNACLFHLLAVTSHLLSNKSRTKKKHHGF